MAAFKRFIFKIYIEIRKHYLYYGQQVGDVWKDGPCRTCECHRGSNTATCTEQFCQTPPESENYVYEATNVNNKCCPIYKRIRCKVGEKEYEVKCIFGMK